MKQNMQAGARVALGVLLLLLVAALFTFLAPYMQLDYLESQRDAFEAYYAREPFTVIALYFLIAVGCVGLALPATGVFALLAGVLFGFGAGVVWCTLATTLGATLVFLWSRHLFRDWIHRRFAVQLEQINRGVDREGGFYLFSIRLMMVFPFFLVNLLSGLTSLRLSTYIIATFLSQAIVGAVWVYAGATLASLDSAADVLTLKTFTVLALIGLTPLIFHRLLQFLRSRRQLTG